MANPVTIKRPTQNQQAPRAGLSQTNPATMGPVQKLQALAVWTASQVVGREELVRALMLALVARTNCLFIGPPGTGKTMAVDLMTKGFCSKPGDVFHTLLTKFTKRDEVIGPVDIQALEQGNLRFNTAGFLPEAIVGVLDEVFKGSSAILNALLSIANERRFQNGADWQDTPTRMLVGMSNEFPDEPALLAAFFDRFPIKMMVGYLDDADFGTMLTTVSAPRTAARSQPPVILNDQDFQAIDRMVEAVKVGPDIVKAVMEFRHGLAQANVKVSDRRWAQALRIMRANAVLFGRAALDRTDLKVLKLVCWNQEADQAAVDKLMPDFENPMARELRVVLDEVYAERNNLMKALNIGPGVDKAKASPDFANGCQGAAKIIGRIRATSARLEVIQDMVQGDEDSALLDQARESVQVIDKLVIAFTRGQNKVEELLGTLDTDIKG